LPLLSVNLSDGVRLPEANDSRPAPSLDLSGYQVVHRGDLVVNQLGKPHGSLGISPFDGIISPAYFVCGLKPDVEPEFVHHLVRTRLYISEYERRGKWMPPSQFDISWIEFRDIDVILPPRWEQKSIANFLDRETSRLDALVAKKRYLTTLLEERYWNWVSKRVLCVKAPAVQLRRTLVSITDGPFGSSLTSNHYWDAGARVVRLGNIGMGEFKDEDKAYISTEHYATLLKHRVRADDLLIAGLGDANNHVGRGCVAPDLGPAIVKADCYRATVDQRIASAHFLALYLSSPLGRSAVANLSRGSTRTRINLDVAKAVPLILPPLPEQKAIVAEANRLHQTTSLLRACTNREQDLM